MRFNAHTCYILSTHCKTGPKTGACASTHKSATFYLLLQLENRLPILFYGEKLQYVPNTPYLGVTLSRQTLNLIFTFLNKNVAKSYECLAFVRCNLKYCSEKLRRLFYISLIRSNTPVTRRSVNAVTPQRPKQTDCSVTFIFGMFNFVKMMIV